MTQIIILAIKERNMLEREIKALQNELIDTNDFFPLTEDCQQSILMKLCVLTEGVAFLERMVINGLCEIPLINYLTEKAKENE